MVILIFFLLKGAGISVEDNGSPGDWGDAAKDDQGETYKKTNTKDKGTQTKTNTMGKQATEEMLQKIIITIHRNIAPSLAQP